jgi:hypothetical protein
VQARVFIGPSANPDGALASIAGAGASAIGASIATHRGIGHCNIVVVGASEQHDGKQ